MAAIKPTTKGKSPKPRRTVWHKIVTAAVVAIDCSLALGLIASAHAGALNPVAHPTAPVVAMTFPFWLLAALAAFLITIIIRWKQAAIMLLALAVCWPSIVEFSPMHIFHKQPNQWSDTFTLMSYNVYALLDQTDEYPGDVNPTLSYILNANPDIVCLQEYRQPYVSPSLHITAAQIDSLHNQYPYIYIGSRAQAIFSKFPVEPIQTGFVYSGRTGAADMACFRVNIHGKTINIFNVHLQSFSLQDSDKQMFARLTTLKGSEAEIDSMGMHLVNKIRRAAPIRTQDTEDLLRYIKKFGGPDAIVCGDFNDVPGSYPLRLLKKDHFKEVYPQVGLGPMITYNARRFYFRIDHILYRGALRPLEMHRGNVRSSDHYPITATFELE